VYVLADGVKQGSGSPLVTAGPGFLCLWGLPCPRLRFSEGVSEVRLCSALDQAVKGVHWQPHRSGARRRGLRLPWVFKLEPFAGAHRGESEPLVAWVVRSVDLSANGRSDLGAKVTRARWSVASRAQAVPA
jgi:hypothetical protein